MIIHGIVRLPFNDISGVYHALCSRFNVFLVNQHDADEQTKTTHCHFLVDLTTQFKNLDGFRKYFKTLSPVLTKGIYEFHTETIKDKKPYCRMILAAYILKGKDPLLVKGYTDAEIVSCKDSWRAAMHHVELIDPATGPDHEVIKAQASKAPTHWQMLLEMLDEPSQCFGETDGQLNCYSTKPKTLVVTPRDLKHIVIRVLKRHRTCPHPKTINNMIGSMINMVDDDVNYNGYEEACIRGFNYKFSDS